MPDATNTTPDIARRVEHGSLPLRGGAMGAALLCCVLWGGNSVAVKLAQDAFAPLEMAALRFGLGAIGLGAWALVRRIPLTLSPRHAALLLANGLMLFAQIGLFNLGTVWSTSIHSVILINVFPFFTAVFAHWWLPHFPLSRRKVLGLAVAFLGVVAMFGDQLTAPDRLQLWGDLLLLGSAAVLGLKLTYQKTLLPRIGALQVVFWEALTSVPMFVAASLWLEGPLSPATLSLAALSANSPPVATAAVLYQGWAVSGVAFLLWTVLLARHSPHELSAFSFTTPLFGMLAGWLLLGEPITAFLLIGGVLIALGIYQVNAR
jgi:drug/metabolite transporter (DMT)-like permease